MTNVKNNRIHTFPSNIQAVYQPDTIPVVYQPDTIPLVQKQIVFGEGGESNEVQKSTIGTDDGESKTDSATS